MAAGKPEFVEDNRMVYPEKKADEGAPPFRRTVSSETVPMPQGFPAEGHTVIETDLRDRTFIKPPPQSDVVKPWCPKGRTS